MAQRKSKKPIKGRRGRPLTFSGSFSSAGVDAALGELADGLRETPEKIDAAIRDIADAIERFLAESIANGTDAYGEPWTLTKDDRVPLRNAMSGISVRAAGRSVVVALDGVEVLHHIGIAKGYKGGTKMRRPIIPENHSASAKHKGTREKGFPKHWEEEIRRIVSAHLGIE